MLDGESYLQQKGKLTTVSERLGPALITNLGISPSWSPGWHRGGKLVSGKTSDGQDTFFTPELGDAGRWEIFEMDDEHAGCVIVDQERKRLWAPYSHGGFRSSQFGLGDLVASPCSRWTVLFTEGAETDDCLEFQLSLGPAKKMVSSGWNGKDYSGPKEKHIESTF